jgi:hypothetical protein
MYGLTVSGKSYSFRGLLKMNIRKQFGLNFKNTFVLSWAVVLLMSGCSSGTTPQDVVVDVSDVIDVNDTVQNLDVPDTNRVDIVEDVVDAVDAGVDVPPPVCSMKVGAAKRDISPVVEPFDDVNANMWRDEGESFTDTNGNLAYDPTYIAGFGSRQAQGIHDPIWSRCMAIESTGQAHLFCASDVIGLGLVHYDKVVARIQELRPEHHIDFQHVSWASTHTHQGPDTQGVWDLMPLTYLEFIDESTAQAAVEALDNLEPGGIRVVAATDTADLIEDIDVPVVKDPIVTILQGVAENGDVVGTVVSVANHPESAGADNEFVSSDFPHFMREKIETAVGGMAIYFSGDLGLMQTPVKDWNAISMEFAESVGNAYGDKVLAALADAPAPTCEFIYTAEVRQAMVLENFDFYAGILAGLINGFDTYLYNAPGACEMMGCVDVPLSAVKFGNLLTWVNIPGEMVPELVTGNYPDPEPVAGEFADAEREPFVESFITTQYRFIAGLSDTEIGYVYPRYQDDRANHEHQRNSSGAGVATSLMEGYAKVFADIAAQEGL